MNPLPDWLPVSRGYEKQWDSYLSLLRTWNARINLVAGEPESWWRRHLLDSAQLSLYVRSPSSSIVDLGSGAGFPGMALALMGFSQVTLVESDRRKCAFLEQVRATCGVPVTILRERAEALPSLSADYVVSRALAPLPLLLDYAFPHLRSDSICLFPKGKNYSKEVADVRRYRFECFTHPSKLDTQSVVLELHSVQLL